MRCLSCNVALSDREATRRSQLLGDFIDLCDRCYAPIQQEVPSNERIELEADTPELSEDDSREQGE